MSWTRGVRATLVAGVTVGVSVAAHATFGGMLPSAPATALLLLLTGAATFRLSRRHWSIGRLSVLMALVEIATHYLCTLAPYDGQMTGQMTGQMNGQMTGMHLTAGMLLGHVLAGAASVVYLRCGEQALWDLVRSTALRLVAVPRVELALPVVGTAPVPSGVRVLSSRAVLASCGIRGPPS